MHKLFKFLFVLLIVVSLHTTYYIIHTAVVFAQEPIPELLLSCSEHRDNEFHSLRPYQAAPCGNAPQALFCSNKLVVFETFDLSKYCQKYKTKTTRQFDCSFDHYVGPHDINITLDESEFPIMGNTEDQFDDATKMNEYASWYLNGVIDKKENKDATDDQIVNFSGPVRKLLPSIIQDSERINLVKSYRTEVTYTDNDGGQLTKTTEPENHDQIVVDNLRLSDWDKGSLSIVRSVVATPIGQGMIGAAIGATGNIINQGLQSVGVNLDAYTGAWNKRTPPLPWDDGTVPDDKLAPVDGKETSTPKKPFASQMLYQKAYNEWLGKSCVILPVVGLQCIDDPLVKNSYADLWHFVPLSNNSDQKGKNYLLTGDGPNYVPSQGTEITGQQHKSYRNAQLYFAHTKEVNDLSTSLNQTFRPQGYESEKLPKTTEKIKKGTKTIDKNALTPLPGNQVSTRDPYASLDCSAVNVRVNPGDNLFPGDKKDNKELYVEGIEYHIVQARCQETYTPPVRSCGPLGLLLCKESDIIKCTGQVGIEFKLGTKTPYANEIFADTVADSGSTFRKIFPKVEEGAPVECIADIPTTTGVKYEIDKNLTQVPNGATQELKTTAYPNDGSANNDNLELTFPHIGSVYEYFLKGIQTALRPKGYGEPIANGNCKTNNEEMETGACKQWLLDEKVYNKVIAKASSTKCNGKSLNPFWAIGIGLNENGGLMTDTSDGSSSSHFGCNVSQVQSIDEKIDCMVNTLRNDCMAGKTDQQTLSEYGYPSGYVLWPITVLNPGGTYPPPLFGSGFNTSQLIANLKNADWRTTYASQASKFCPNSPSFAY